ncbi:MAG: hypothetical protein JO167_10970 [Alphaproteobacteria bacterium]|nr:hypothetical protein [Alphaproteobacteria bacterium]MBV9541777.1 hypothetical protein [Alphaproteobacteria bacterium]MBV9904355.1 hypothetical protein [Alphaproteobacteria bacterium]
MKYSLPIIFIISLFASACSTPILTSETWSPAPSKDRDTEILGGYWLPVAKFPVTIKRAKCVVTIDFGDATFVPDNVHHYRVAYNHDPFSADDIAVETDDAGLLKSVNASSDPQYSAVIGKVFEVAGDVAKIATLMRLNLVAGANHCDPDVDVEVTALVDPTAAHPAEAFTGLLPPDMTVKISAERAAPLAQATIRQSSGCQAGASGVCFRPPWPYTITVEVSDPTLTTTGSSRHKQQKEHQNTVDKRFASVIPDPEVIMQITLNRNGPAKTDIKLEFSHGVLTKYENNQPSTVLAWVGIPADILKGILGLAPSSGSAAGSGGE